MLVTFCYQISDCGIVFTVKCEKFIVVGRKLGWLDSGVPCSSPAFAPVDFLAINILCYYGV